MSEVLVQVDPQLAAASSLQVLVVPQAAALCTSDCSFSVIEEDLYSLLTLVRGGDMVQQDLLQLLLVLHQLGHHGGRDLGDGLVIRLVYGVVVWSSSYNCLLGGEEECEVVHVAELLRQLRLLYEPQQPGGAALLQMVDDASDRGLNDHILCTVTTVNHHTQSQLTTNNAVISRASNEGSRRYFIYIHEEGPY